MLLDFVPVHFAVDDYALWQYDGTALYEYPHSDVGVSEWGSCNFMHSRGEVRSFLQSAAQYWLEEFHFDGLRMDAVSRLIYWQGDPARGENQNGLAFLRGMNLGLKALHPTAILAAEDSTAWPGVTAPAQEGGLGFDYKWDIGWMHDTLTYFQSPAPPAAGEVPPAHLLHGLLLQRALPAAPLPRRGRPRQGHHCPEDVRGVRGEVPPGPGAVPVHDGPPWKKLNFMGFELAQLREWDERRQQDWELLRYPVHDGFAHFIQTLITCTWRAPPCGSRTTAGRASAGWPASRAPPACTPGSAGAVASGWCAWSAWGMPRRRGRCNPRG